MHCRAAIGDEAQALRGQFQLEMGEGMAERLKAAELPHGQSVAIAYGSSGFDAEVQHRQRPQAAPDTARRATLDQQVAIGVLDHQQLRLPERPRLSRFRRREFGDAFVAPRDAIIGHWAALAGRRARRA